MADLTRAHGDRRRRPRPHRRRHQRRLHPRRGAHRHAAAAAGGRAPGDTDEVAAILAWATEHGVPVTARGSGTGLSGACIPRPDGILVSFERMAEILEIDTDNHVAVVQPGVTLDQLDEALKPHGLVYPVFPGESSASLGGNVATNAGGMRAVNYGVTRHQVLGLAAVLGTGEVLRTGGKFVKATTGYDLTQLIIGSEGTLALVTEAIAAALPAPHPRRHDPRARSPPSTRSPRRPRDRRLRPRAHDPRVHRLHDDGRHDGERRPRARRARGRQGDDARLPRGRAREPQRRPPRGGHRRAGRAGRRARRPRRVRAARARAGAALIEAREKAFWMAKASGADDIIDLVVPRASIPDYLERVQAIAEATGSLIVGCGHAGDGNVHLSVFQADPDRAHPGDGRRPRRRRRRSAARSPASTASAPRRRSTSPPSRTRPSSTSCAASRRRSTPPASSTPAPSSTDRAGPTMNGAQALIRTLVDAGVDVCFMNPGTSEMHFVAALDDVPEMRGVLALFEGVATGAADGYARMADRPAAMLLHLGPGPRQRPGQPAQRPQGVTPVVNIVGDHATYHKQYDAQLESDIETVARNVSTWIRTSASTDERCPATPPRRSRRRCGPPGQVATLILPADVCWSEGGEPAPAAPPRRRAAVDAGQRRRARRRSSRGDEPAALFVGGRACRADALRRRQPHRRRHRRQAAGRDVPRPPRARRRAVPVDRLAYLAEFAAMQLDGLQHLVLVDTKAPVSFFAYPGKASDLVPEGCKVHVLAGPDGDPAAALGRARRRRGRAGRRRHDPGRRPARPAHRPAHRRRRLPGRRRPAPRGRHRLRRGQHLGPLRRRAHRRARPPTTGSASPAAPSARACRSRSAPRSPRPTAR